MESFRYPRPFVLTFLCDSLVDAAKGVSTCSGGRLGAVSGRIDVGRAGAADRVLKDALLRAIGASRNQVVRCVLGIDAGGTKTRALLADEDARVVAGAVPMATTVPTPAAIMNQATRVAGRR